LRNNRLKWFRMDKIESFAIFLISLGLALIAHHCVFFGRIADLKDIMHHEFFEAILLTAGITILFSIHYEKRKRCGNNEHSD